MQAQTPQSTQTPLEAAPGDSFETPEKLLADSSIAQDKKVLLLEQWAADLEDRLRASDENMPGAEPGQTGDLLRRVKSAQRLLSEA